MDAEEMFWIRNYGGVRVMKDSKIIIMCAFRYALTRGSYVVGEVCDYIKEHVSVLSDSQIASIIAEINSYEFLKKNFERDTVNVCLEAWLDLRDWLKEKLDERKN